MHFAISIFAILIDEVHSLTEYKAMAAKIIDEILKDDELKMKLAIALADLLVTRKETNEILEAIKALREDFERETTRIWDEIKALREETQALRKEIKALREDFERETTRIWNEIKALREETQALREDLNNFGLKLNALGSRWGIFAEEAFRNALRGLLEKRFNVKVSKWEVYDSKGIVFHDPAVVDVDVVITDSEHILIEIKSSISKSDVATLLRKGELYKAIEGVDPKLMIVSPFVDDKAKEFALKKKVQVYTSAYEPIKF